MGVFRTGGFVLLVSSRVIGVTSSLVEVTCAGYEAGMGGLRRGGGA